MGGAGGTNSVGDAVGESHELDLVLGALPIRVEGQNKSEGGCLGVCGGVGESDVSQSRRGTVHVLGGAHGGTWKGRNAVEPSGGEVALSDLLNGFRDCGNVSLEFEAVLFSGRLQQSSA